MNMRVVGAEWEPFHDATLLEVTAEWASSGAPTDEVGAR